MHLNEIHRYVPKCNRSRRDATQGRTQASPKGSVIEDCRALTREITRKFYAGLFWRAERHCSCYAQEMDAEFATLVSGFGGALLGAVVGGMISWVLARQSAANTARRDKEARNQEQKAHALRLMVKASLVLSDVVAIKNSIDQSLSEANEKGLSHYPFWRRVLPIVSSYQTYPIEASELAPLMEAKANEIVYAATDMLMKHSILVAALERYSEKRGELKKIMKRHTATEDGVLTSALTEDEVAEMAPYEIELESLIKEVRSRLEPIQNLTEKVTYGIGPAIQTHYGDKEFPVFVAAETGQEAPAAS
ncbi:MAG: hypothetical protein RIA09_08965 [Hoeflea sp.]|uniref:hypothetical protein n=1 Tax=Hoeflea sp. TaxID=1940281 RepID=UPI0032EB841A